MRCSTFTSIAFLAVCSVSVLSVPVPSPNEQVTFSTTLPRVTLEKRSSFPSFNYFSGFAKGGSAQSGNSGNVDGGNVVNIGGKIFNGPWASKYLLNSLISW